MASERSASGESSVYKDESGRWHGYVSMGLKENGQRDRRHVSGARRGDVVTKVRLLETRRDAGTATVSGKGLTLEQWLDHWMTNVMVDLAPSTRAGYLSKINVRIVPALGHHRLDRLQPEHVEAFYARCRADGLSPATVLQIHRILSHALKTARNRDRVRRNVCELVKVKTPDRAEIVPFTAQEARQLLGAARNVPNAARWFVALALGLRQGEALGLKWEDIDLERGTLTVRRALQRQKGKGLVEVKPKSRSGRRTVVLPAPLAGLLREHRAEQLERRLLAGSLWEHRDFVFAQANGRPIDPGSDWKAWKAMLRRAGLRDARLHDARHTAATLLLQQGVAARVAMQILGHSQISLTLGTYSHVVPELAHEAAERMSEALWGQLATTLAPSPQARPGG